MSDYQLKEIWVYPIKSLGGIRLQQAAVLAKGLQYDRRWMLVDENGKFLTQREYPELALFKTRFENDMTSLSVRYRDSGIVVPLESITEEMPLLPVQIWDDLVLAAEVDPNLSTWFSERLNTSCKLVFFPESNPRPVEREYQINNDHVSLADAYPFMVIGEKSLEDLNSKLAEPVPMNRFRPNFVFSGGAPFDEDSWKTIMIGECQFAAVKLCGRCTIITIDQTTSQRGPEPLKTLSTFRRKDNNVKFGMNLILLRGTEIKEGDTINIESYQ